MKIFFKKVSVVLLLAICICSTPVLGQESVEKEKFLDESEIKIQLAEAISLGEEAVAIGRLENQETGLAYDMEIYALPLDENREYTSSDKAESICYIASTDYMTVDESTIPDTMLRGGENDSMWDSTGSANFTLGYDFDRNSSGYIQLTYIWGNSYFTSGVGLASSQVGCAQHSAYTGVYETRIWNVGSSFGNHTGFSGWVPDSTATALFGTNWNATLSRGGSTWGFSLPVYRYL